LNADDPECATRDREWLAALQRREPFAFERLFQLHARALYRRVLLPRLGNAAAAEDVLADTFQRAFERIGDFEDRGKGVWGWLATIAANRARDLQREQQRRGRALVNFSALLAPLAEDAPALESSLEHQRLRAEVERVLGRLSPRYRRAVELRFFEERSREECAALLEVKLGTFDVVLLRALRAFRKAWDERATQAPE
jgi:RNA polymerase sigma factor (sigma-70 family)